LQHDDTLTLREEHFEIPSRDGYPLRGDVRYPAGDVADGAPAIVVSHGFKGFKDWGSFPTIAREFAAAGYIAVSFNTSGSGIGPDLQNFTDPERFERATISGDVDDIGRILDAIAGGALPGPRAGDGVGLVGHSRGGGVSLIAAGADPRVRAVAVWASVSSFGRWSPGTVADWRTRGFVAVENLRTKQVFHLRTDILDDLTAHANGRLSIERACKALQERGVPVLVLHGDADEAVRIAEGRAIAEWSGGELVALPGAGHTFGAVHPFRGRTPDLDRVLTRTRDFFQHHLPLGSAS
jgi:uncharacterized protein